MRTVIFDLDGTLADTSGDLIAAANHCFGAMGERAPLDVEHDAATALLGGRAMLTLGLTRLGRMDRAEVDRWYPELLRAYADALDVHTVLYPGAVGAVQALLSGGYRTGICTNKPEALADTLLQRLGVRDLFGAMIGADTLAARKPDPAPYVAAVTRAGGAVSQSCLIGDSVTDRDTAIAAGVPCVLVTFGPAGDDMAALEPEALLADFADLLPTVGRLLA